METMLVFSRDDVEEYIPYKLIVETRHGCRWNTGRRKRLWMQDFTEAERRKAARLFASAHNWYLVKGVPDSIRMSYETYHLWQKLGMFCALI